MHWDTIKQDNYSTVGGDGGCGGGEVRSGTTSPMPDHKGFKLQQVSEIHPLHFRNSALLRVNIGLVLKANNCGLNMIDLQSFIKSLVAGWILRIQAADPNIYSWVQLPKHYLQKLHEVGLNLRFSFDESVVF